MQAKKQMKFEINTDKNLTLAFTLFKSRLSSVNKHS